jgi:hypothetical protein
MSCQKKGMLMPTFLEPHMKDFSSFRDFYPFYLSQHANLTCRNLHLVGSLSGLVMAVSAILTGAWWLVLAGIATGYACSWTGHFFFEKNKPATFTWPWYSFLGDWQMVWDAAKGKLPASLSPSRKTH